MGNKRDTYVIVTVDTMGIEKAENYPIEIVEFSDNRGANRIESSKFSSIVDKGKKIIWIGIPKYATVGDVVQFVDIKQILIKGENDSQILKKNYYSDVNDNGVVVGRMKYPKLNEEDPNSKIAPHPEHYNITILVNGKNWYAIDPQMEMTI